MAGIERDISGFNPDKLLPWQREVEAALVYLTRDQQALRNSEFRSQDEIELVWRVAQRVGNLTNVFMNTRQIGVDDVPDHIKLPSTNPRFKRIYNTHTREVREIPLKNRFLIFKHEDHDNSVLVEPDNWVRNEEIVDTIKSNLIGLLHLRNRELIMTAFEVDMQPIETK